MLCKQRRKQISYLEATNKPAITGGSIINCKREGAEVGLCSGGTERWPPKAKKQSRNWGKRRKKKHRGKLTGKGMTLQSLTNKELNCNAVKDRKTLVLGTKKVEESVYVPVGWLEQKLSFLSAAKRGVRCSCFRWLRKTFWQRQRRGGKRMNQNICEIRKKLSLEDCYLTAFQIKIWEEQIRESEARAGMGKGRADLPTLGWNHEAWSHGGSQRGVRWGRGRPRGHLPLVASPWDGHRRCRLVPLPDIPKRSSGGSAIGFSLPAPLTGQFLGTRPNDI